MKIIECLNKIANKEQIRVWSNESFRKIIPNLSYDELVNCLNDEIEIIEVEKKIPEKLNKNHFHRRQRQMANKINEIIDYLEDKEN